MSVFTMGTNKAINITLKINETYFNFNNAVNLTIERNIGDSMNAFALTVVDGSKETTDNIDMVFNSGGKSIEINYGFGSNLTKMKGFIVDYTHTFVGDVYQVELTGYISLLTSVTGTTDIQKYYIDWAPCIPRRLHEGLNWDVFYNTVQNEAISSTDTDWATYDLARFSDYYSTLSYETVKDLNSAEEGFYDTIELALKNIAELCDYNGSWQYSWGSVLGLSADVSAGIASSEATIAKAQEFLASFSLQTNNILAIKLEGPGGYCYIPNPDLFILWDNTDPNSVSDGGMCDITAFGLNYQYTINEDNEITGMSLSSDWGKICPDTNNSWKLRVLNVDGKTYLWVGDIPEKIELADGYSTDTIKKWLVAAYNSATTLTDSSIRVSDIVRNLCDLEGWDYDDSTIVSTDFTSAANESLRMDGVGAFQFIQDNLCPLAVSAAGNQYNYNVWFDDENKLHFEPLVVEAPKEYVQLTFGYNIDDSPVISFKIQTAGATIAAQQHDSVSGVSSATGESVSVTSTSRTFQSALVAGFESGDTEYLLFNESLYNTIGGTSNIGTYEWYQNNFDTTSTFDNCVSIASQQGTISSVGDTDDAAAVLVKSMSDFESTLIIAEMVCIGNPEIKANRWIKVLNMVKGGRTHYSSGDYWIKSVTDSISTSGFTQTVQLIRYAESSNFFYNGDSDTSSDEIEEAVDNTIMYSGETKDYGNYA